MSVLVRSGTRLSGARWARALSTTRVCAVATNFGMPAMSPTMTEGGIVEWKIKPGDTFAAGDVLLEIETDKAQIDVEAADDGVLAKIYAPEGTKSIAVNTPIAVLAEIGDDLSNLEYPEVASAPVAEADAKADDVAETVATPSVQSSPVDITPPTGTNLANAKQTLLPSVSTLLHRHNISSEVALTTISASGPQGRLLKGDVLAHLGLVDPSKIGKLSAAVSNWSKLDLSNIKLRPEAPVSSKAKPATKATKPVAKTLTGQFRLEVPQDTTFSLKSLVDRAAQLAQKDSIRLAQRAQEARSQSVRYDAAFEALLAPAKNIKPFESSFKFAQSSPVKSRAVKTDIYALLAGQVTPPPSPLVDNVHRLDVQVVVNPEFAGAEARAQAYLDRLAFYLSDGKALLI
ncbi:hypothetical protein NADFUDRAFT_49171 [Nadsonia fulvescens var. elongata DSM 6958]|uniref:Dihydrolipoamide acetyltransferase component of pyruvate dehydrogenase complex n=1 Tax=Nadsonia fulvescens var. elongata DSM 6958 TaxID=857566 RepID=A0A1E3PTE9_9ASCO|nr:hypothetical protein NADFUDRAFT_49171 [Nadsonia fulvescens var. elongata DSM 6958]